MDEFNSIIDLVLTTSGSEGLDTNGADFDILREAVIAAGLVETLSAENADLTVFAPTDEAFIKLARTLGVPVADGDEAGALAGILEALTALGGSEEAGLQLLTNVLLYHVSAGAQTVAEIQTAGSVSTALDGATFGVDGTELIDNDPDVVNPQLIGGLTDLDAGNGLVHAINWVLLPLDVPGTAALGTDGNDSVRGTREADFLLGLDGDDSLRGGFGNDSLVGGLGDDQLIGGFGDDLLLGGAGEDSLRGGFGDDLLDGGEDGDRLIGGFGDDELIGGGGDDTLRGGFGDDVLSGGEGDDSLRGGFGDDALTGGNGDDDLSGGFGDDVLTGGLGQDQLRGGFGHDRFVFNSADESADDASGLDVIHDFRVNDDTLELSFVGDANDITVTAVANGTLVSTDDFAVLLSGLEATADDLSIVIG